MEKPQSAPLKRTFESIIESRILSGELKPGDRLPPERVLAAQTGISRSSINLGILSLESRGFLRVVPRKGTFVADYRRDATPQTLSVIMKYDSADMDRALVHDLVEMRILIECECARLAAPLVDKRSAELLDGFVERLYSDDYEKLVDTLYEFHRLIVNLSGNSAYAMIFNSFESVLRTLTQAHYESKQEFHISVPLYLELAEALKAHDALRAFEAMNTVLTLAEKYLLNMLPARPQPTSENAGQPQMHHGKET